MMLNNKLNKISVAFMIVCSAGMLMAGCGDEKGGREVTISTESLFTTIAPTTEEITTQAASTTQEIIVYEDTGAPTEITDYEYEEPIGEADPNVDIDLTVLTPNMIYVQVYNMMYSAEDYMGKTIKVSGTYYPMYYEELDNYYHYVMIKDAESCCQNGMEFIWDDGSHVYPDEYPEEDAEIQIIGTFSSYIEEDFEYYYLDVDEIILLD